MFSHYALKQSARSSDPSLFRGYIISRRCVHYDGRNRLSNFWTPTQWTQGAASEAQIGHDLLVRAGFLRQAYSGIFQLLPLGLRVQNKIERLIDKHMLSLGASKVSLSSLSSEDLWQRSGRLDKGRTSELIRFEDRKGTKYLLSPTHEEEITTIVANAVKSYKDLPLRLYQVSRKYRDEPRPRQGLLRGREFVMKDLYTFDATVHEARKTYEDVRKAYVAFLEDLRLPYLTAQASSGNMGGDLSHEYHFASLFGEDTIIRCESCDYSLNEELYVGKPGHKQLEIESTGLGTSKSKDVASEIYISKDRKELLTILWNREDGEPNIYAVKALFPSLDSSVQGEAAREQWIGDDLAFYRDPRLSKSAIQEAYPDSAGKTIQPAQVGKRNISLTKARNGDRCPSCDHGKLKLHQAVEIGHTFYLGTRYSVPLEAQVMNEHNKPVPIEMGCHGIGVSRLIGAVASLLMDKKGLNWPITIAPFDVMVVPGPKATASDAELVCDRLSTAADYDSPLDVAIDDREQGVGYKLHDADLIGYPFVAVIGRTWGTNQEVELQCKRLGIKKNVPLDQLQDEIREHSKQL